MAQEGMREPEVKKVHPFFAKGSVADLANPSDSDFSNSQNPSLAASSNETLREDAQLEPEIQTGRKRRKTDTTLPHDAPGPKKQRRKRQSEGLPASGNANATIEQSLNIKPTEPATSDVPMPSISDTFIKPIENPSQSAQAVSSNISNPLEANTKTRVLKWNPKTGTLGSPPKSKSKSSPSRIVCIKYGRDDANRKDLGDKISQLLEGKIMFPPTPPKRRGRKTKENSTTQGGGSSKTTHPFFSGKAKQTLVANKENNGTVEGRPSRQTVFMSTPMSPKKARNPFTTNIQAPRFGVKTGVAKVPGAMQPLWPAKGMAHVRGFDLQPHSTTSLPQEQMDKKSKGSTVTVTSDESVLGEFCTSMDLTAIRDALPRDDSNFEPAPDELRTPTRHFESGRKLQKRVRSELRTLRLASAGMDDDVLIDDAPDVQSRRTHPAINRLYEALETSLSAYDKSTCESLSWTHKYAPAAASEILQAGKEALLLKDWLQTLKVQSVSTASTDAGPAKAKAKSKAAPKKKRKKDELDDFIVNSEEEAKEMDEISENEDDWAPAGSGLLKKTVIRNGDAAAKDQVRLTNAVVISGPHGSGKTATVYAIAKELGFEIFEINSGSRRSGKDILEKVGDMTRNHLVQRHRADPASGVTEEDEVAKDLKSGKQGMMTAFFKSKTTAPKAPAKQPVEEASTATPKTSSAKSQKQSLILLEEVDVLYEEDKQFWATLMGMMAQSKRPFIMTCNDETMVPLQSLDLHGIFRFSPPPIGLAIDLCLLTAANEGHILQRTAVEALYKSRNNDLRSSLTELNYWCQIGVGDRKGGFDWFYLRWPKGSDLDENGDVVRVLSEETYCKGMGWLGRDLIATCPDPLKSEEEAMKQSWDSWTLDAGDWNTTLDLQSWADGVSQNVSEQTRRLQALTVFDEFCTSMSDADLLSSGVLGTGFQEIVDPELPEIPVKMRDDFIVGRRLLEADPKILSSSPSANLAMSLKSLARQTLLDTSPATAPPLEPLTEKRVVSTLGRSFEPSTPPLHRIDLAYAFDPIAINEKTAAASYLDPSVFDRTTRLIVLDVAPWIRGIVEFDNSLMQERLKLSSLLSEGGRRKRMRTTRSAYSALEGGERRTTRRERYFGDTLNAVYVRRTAGKGWQEAALESAPPKESAESLPSSPPSSPGSSAV
ncbi:hypothetical protein FSARC_1499 [Fusarium sarcochroum]|uniref:ATPase AAA-type core domain-containing protein n=1 Tax=Fusarium sarcochroum TaxID=1208366 RepID=A0A8H4XEZ0_9HYPO|nr:hypothetical protein FSARC_1499 [Fusarium sarcochroum]